MMEQSAAKDQHGLALSSGAIQTTGGGALLGILRRHRRRVNRRDKRRGD